MLFLEVLLLQPQFLLGQELLVLLLQLLAWLQRLQLHNLKMLRSYDRHLLGHLC